MSIQDNLKNLKQKLETRPKHIISQTQTLSFKIYTFDLNSEIDPNEIASLCKSYQKEEFREKATESVYAWRSDYTTINKNNMVGFENLFNIVEEKVKPAYNLPYTYSIGHYWFAIYSNGDSSKVHHHGWVDFACVYYAAVPEGSAPLVIPTTTGNISIAPKPGMLVVMPGNCEHLVPNSEHEGERIVVAMNIIRDKFLKSTDDLEPLKK
jgi:hypothetical protein